jgi:hypothetical protein
MNKKPNSMSGRPGVLARGSRGAKTRAQQSALGSKIVELPHPKSRVPRLPTYDDDTRRMETGALILLGAIAVTLVWLAAGNAARFSENRDEIAAGLSSDGSVVTASSGARDTNHVLTNLTAVPALWHGAPANAARDQS